MRVVFATAELSPVATVGGLAAAADGLGTELRRLGVDVDLVMPDYRDVALVDETTIDLDVDLHRNGRGFVAGRAASDDLLAALFRAERRVHDRRRRAPIQKRVMAIDWSWRQPASEYVELYRELTVNQS